jgi:FkbM family methyltransferase
MIMKELAKWILPPLLLVAARWLRRGKVVDSRRITFQYGDFVLQCDASHSLPKILTTLPDFGRNLADIVLTMEVHEPRVIDVGANIGDTALLLARFAPGAKVLCVEGDPHFMADLKVNASQITGVTLAQAILSDRTFETRGKFVVSHGTAHLELDAAGETIRMVTLDDLAKEHVEFSNPHVIKVDTDGFDPAILRGAKNTLTSSRPVVFYEWHPYSYGIAGENDTSHADFLMSLGYRRFIIYTNRGEPLLITEAPGRDIWESLGRFSRGRLTVDGLHYDIAAFPEERADVWKRLAQHYSTSGIYEHLGRQSA